MFYKDKSTLTQILDKNNYYENVIEVGLLIEMIVQDENFESLLQTEMLELH